MTLGQGRGGGDCGEHSPTFQGLDSPFWLWAGAAVSAMVRRDFKAELLCQGIAADAGNVQHSAHDLDLEHS